MKDQCPHTPVVVLTPAGPHHAKEVCTRCGRFLRWLPKPETLERIGRNTEIIKRLDPDRLTEWEKSFVETVVQQGYRCSPKQQPILDRLGALHG